MRAGHDGSIDISPQRTNATLYSHSNPLGDFEFGQKVKLLEDMNAYARGLDARVMQFSASISGEWQAVQIIRPDGDRRSDMGLRAVIQHLEIFDPVIENG